jgi:hypothetical protein
MNVDVTDQVHQLIAESLSEARSVIQEGGTWDPLVHIVHPQGVQSMFVLGLHAGSNEKSKLVDEINNQMSALKVSVSCSPS